MKNKIEIKREKEFDSVAFFRAVKTKISKKIYGKTLAEVKAYFRQRQLKLKVEKDT